MEKDYLDRTAFTDKDSVLDLYSNSLRKASEFDSYGNKTTFRAVVLTKPIFLANADLSEKLPAFVNTKSEEDDKARLSKFAFKARILAEEAPSPHQFLPDPCNPTFAQNAVNKKFINQIVNLHTTFISSDDYTRGENIVPKTGDVVKVELNKNLFSYNLQFGKFISLIDSRKGIGIPSTNPGKSASSEQVNSSDCAASELFAAGAGFGTSTKPLPDNEARALARQYLTRLRSELGADAVLTTGTDSTGKTNQLTKCGTKSSSIFTIKDCVSCNVGGGTSMLHPDFCSMVQKIHSAAMTHMKVVHPNLPRTMEINNAGRTTETQIYLRIINKCGGPNNDYNQIMTNRSGKCTVVPAAPPRSSRHEMGLAVDFGGVLTNRGNGGTRAAKAAGSSARNSALYRFMRGFVHGKTTINYNTTTSTQATVSGIPAGAILKNYDKEPWHWSFDGK
tara:strand:+ start:859 stop:2202 length:1344 start_codon:yes stop_codon:yes gene_type:complete